MKKKRLYLASACFVFAVVTIGGCKPAIVATGTGSKTIYFSPIPSIGVGPNGLPTKKITVTPYCCPSDAIEIIAANGATEDDLQWVNIPLSLPGDTITAVKVCYSSSNNAYISQTRLATMGAPDHATVMLDDATDQKSAAATCYTVATNSKVDGTVTLALKVVVPATGALRIGSIAITVK